LAAAEKKKPSVSLRREKPNIGQTHHNSKNIQNEKKEPSFGVLEFRDAHFSSFFSGLRTFCRTCSCCSDTKKKSLSQLLIDKHRLTHSARVNKKEKDAQPCTAKAQSRLEGR